MQAIMCRELTGPSGLTLEEVDSPTPGPGQIKVTVRACGINFADSLITSGKYQIKPPLPFSPGFEVAGDVVELGPGVATCEVGDRVIGLPGVGGYAEEVLVAAEQVLTMPETMSYVEGAAFPVVYGTSHVALHHRARLQAGEVLVVHGAAGGVGLTAVEIGKRLGATVIATASTPEKLEVAGNHGADHLINYAQEDIRSRVKALTGGRGADVVYDPVGGDTFTASLSSINFEGRIIVIGFASGTVPQIPANLLLVKNVDVIGLNCQAYMQRNPKVLSQSLGMLLSWYAEGVIRPYVSATVPLERALVGLQQVVERKSTGKVVITLG
jgi:NADPH2:quinone reductase